ncbi:MAG: metallophosphoesterase [Promethearchaeota archaeon]
MAKMERIYYTCDIHGSEMTFKKFLNAAEMYDVNTMILAGDLSGKGFALVEHDGQENYKTKIYNEEWTASGSEQFEILKRKMKTLGFYFKIGTKSELKDYFASPKLCQEEYDQLAYDRLANWIERMEEKFKPSGVKIYVLAGNDDSNSIKQTLGLSDYIIDVEDQIVMITESNEMLSEGHSNPTPWNTPREVSEEALAKLLESKTEKLEHPERSIFNIHVPPIDSIIDSVTDIDPKTLKRDLRRIKGAGSQAVREAIEKYQPLVGLHGHIHESRGEYKLGSTVCLNPGSEYAEGILRGVIIAVDDKKLRGYQFTAG